MRETAAQVMTNVESIDLRSDTVTQPCPAMRREIANARIGDDVYGEDPSINALEAHVAELLGKEAALFVPSGTMANQIAIQLHCRPGDQVLVAAGTHCMSSESGAAAAWAGVQFKEVAGEGPFDADDLRRGVGPWLDNLPRPALVVVENTDGSSGGVPWTLSQMTGLVECARALALPVHVDGARLWNACIATGASPSDLSAGADTVSVCFSKGLGAPVGSALPCPAPSGRIPRAGADGGGRPGRR